MKKIENLGNIDKLTVLKSRPLLALWQSDLTLAEFKILDTYLGRIDSHDESARTVVFKRGEFEKLLGVRRIHTDVLDTRLKHLMSSVKIPDPDSKSSIARVVLFEKAYATRDDYGLWTIELTCTETAKKFFFNVEQLKYLRYRLRNVIHLKSRYSYILYLYIWDNKFRESWEISVEELKIMLHCEDDATYQAFKRFNDLILKKCQKEIQNLTDMRFDYEVVKKGRNVVGIRFIYHPQEIQIDEAEADPDLIRDQITIDQWIESSEKPQEQEAPEKAEKSEKYELSREYRWAEPLERFEFSEEQLDAIFSVLITIPLYRMPKDDMCPDSIELARYHYLDEKAMDLIVLMTGKKIRNVYRYFLKMLKNDVIR